MNEQIQAAVNALIDQRRQLQAQVSQIDEALLALKSVGGSVEVKKARTRRWSAESRAKHSEAMRAAWATARSNGSRTLISTQPIPLASTF